MTAVTAQQAALRILLDEVDPLVQRAEAAGQVLTKVREELDLDLETLGRLVQQAIDAQPQILETGRKLQNAAGRIEVAAQARTTTAPRSASGAARRWQSWLAGAMAGFIVTASAGWLLSRDLRDQARAGRALVSAWTSLDPAAKARVQAALAQR